MERHHQENTVLPEDWPKFLTPDYRANFERIGEDLVRANVASHQYRVASEHYAALVWLREKREAKEKRETAVASHVKWTLMVAAATLTVAIIGVLVTVCLAL